MAAQARSPQAVLEAVAPEAVKLVAGLNKAHTAALRTGKGQHTNVMERAKAAAVDYLVHFPPVQHGAILLGALASVYGKEERGSDTAVWLAGSKEEPGQSLSGIGQSSIANETIEALRDTGLLDDIILNKEGLIVYPTGLDQLVQED